MSLPPLSLPPPGQLAITIEEPHNRLPIEARECLWTCCCIPDQEVFNAPETPSWKKICCYASALFCGPCMLGLFTAGALCNCLVYKVELGLPPCIPLPCQECTERQTIDFAQTFFIENGIL